MGKATISLDDLKIKFKERNELLNKQNEQTQKLETAFSISKEAGTKIVGGLENIANLMVDLIGQEEATKIIKEMTIVQPENNGKKEVKENGKKD